MVRNIFTEISEQYSKLWDSRGTIQSNLHQFCFVSCEKKIQILILDTRLSHMPFMQSPLPMVLLVAGYLFIVQTGKKWMEHRQPLPIERLVIAYNFVQIVINSVLVLVVGSIVEPLFRNPIGWMGVNGSEKSIYFLFVIAGHSLHLHCQPKLQF